MPIGFVALLLALTVPALISMPPVGPNLSEISKIEAANIESQEVLGEHFKSAIAWQRFNQYAPLYAQRSFQWQETVSITLFYISILFPAIGLYFAWMQFRDASATERRKKSDSIGAEEIAIESALGKIAVKTRTLATFMVTISLAYLVVYLHFVYTIREISIKPIIPYKEPQYVTKGLSDKIDDTQNPEEVAVDARSDL